MNARELHAVIHLYLTPDGYVAQVQTAAGAFERIPFLTRDACLHDAARELSDRQPSRTALT
jgi:hypothetical protein